MGIKIEGELPDELNDELSHTDYLTLCLIRSICKQDKENICDFTNSELSEILKVTFPTIVKTIQKLERLKLIVVENKRGLITKRVITYVKKTDNN